MTEPVAGYGFLSWLRTGLAGEIGRPDGDPTPTTRASVAVTVVVDAAGDARPVSLSLPLVGPGEVAGLDPRAVIRVAPRPGEIDAEPNELPLVEFAEPDLPWRYTPATADAAGRLRPWLVLAVLRADEITGEEPAGGDGRLPAITVASAAALPRLDQSWAWAHVQLDGFQPATEALTAVDPSRRRARLLAPRHLTPRTAYTAVLVPALERGRLAGLREPVPDTVDGQAPAWAPGATAVRLPVYYRWSFATGEQADFEQLARRLVGRAAAATVGTIALDVATPDPALPAASNGPLTFTGALVSPAADPAPWPADQREAFVARLAPVLNQPADALAADTDSDPIVAPPLWGRWHAAVDRLSTVEGASPQWFQELNADPRLRATAGLGAEVIRRHDDELMAEAWRQVGDVLAANEALRRAQLAREAGVRLVANHLSRLDTDALMQVTAPVHARVLVPPTASGLAAARPATAGPGAVTAVERLRQSPIPGGATDGRVRRVRRRLARRAAALSEAPAGAPGATTAASATTAAPGGLLDRLNRAELRTRPAVETPTGMAVTTLTVPTAAPPRPDVGGETAVGLPVAGTAPLARDVAAGPPRLDWTRAALPRPAPGWIPVAGGLGDAGGLGGAGRPVPVTTDPGTVARTAELFGQAMTTLVADVAAPPAAGPVLRPVDLPSVAATLTAALDPTRTVVAGLRDRLRLAPWLAPATPATADPLDPVMAAPEFDAPMYEPLADLGHEWLLPGAGDIPPETVTVLLPNQAFVEAYLTGLSFEMGRELLFHEYPTDQRGTYFPQFWDVRGALAADGTPADPETLRDIAPIHAWPPDAGLGANPGRVPPPPAGHLVLLVKGELVKRFPNVIVSAVRAAVGGDGRRTLSTNTQSPDTLHPMFGGRLEPDIAFFGFDLSVEAARGDGTDADLGWFFVLAEHPTEPRFGLDADDGGYAGRPAVWPDLNWAQLAADADALAALGYVDLAAALPDVSAVLPAAGDPPVAWHAAGANGADLAWITLRRPFRVAIHGADALPAATP